MKEVVIFRISCLHIFQENYDTLIINDGELYNLLPEENVSEDELLKEMVCSEEYKKGYLHLY